MLTLLMINRPITQHILITFISVDIQILLVFIFFITFLKFFLVTQQVHISLPLVCCSFKTNTKYMMDSSSCKSNSDGSMFNTHGYLFASNKTTTPDVAFLEINKHEC